MIKSKSTELTIDILNKLNISEVIYAEVASAGAMGNSGGMCIYTLVNNEFMCYESSVFKKPEIYNAGVDLLFKHKEDDIHSSESQNAVYFKFIKAGMGNVVFVNVNWPITFGLEFLIFEKNAIQYEIECTCLGVFDGIQIFLSNSSKEYL